MTNSATSTDAPRPAGASGFQAWHFFMLLAMVAATAVVMVAKDTHPAALLLLSAAVVSAGFVGLAISRAITGFFRGGEEPEPLPEHSRDALLREKHLLLRSIKELEFDKAMGKVGEDDYVAIVSRLRARAMTLMADIDRMPPVPAKVAPPVARTSARAALHACAACGTGNDADARFCKSCGARLGAGS
jgi:hypothetical protein